MMRIRLGASALLLAAHACALAQTDPVPQVVVRASTDDQRVQSTTTAIIVGRDEILRQGDSSLADVLKRQPGITVDGSPGKEAAIRMRGMGSGYVAILLNGLPAPNGFSLESISPDLVERIDIARVATADTSSQAVAGTINIILRRAGAAAGAPASDIKLGSAAVDGNAAPQIVASTSGTLGTLAYTLTGTLKRQQDPIAALTTEAGTMPTLLRQTASFDHQREDVLELAPRLAWQPGAFDSVTMSGYLRRRRIDNAKGSVEDTVTGDPTVYPHAAETYRADGSNAYLDAAWTRKFATGARLTAKLSSFSMTRAAAFVYRGMDTQDRLLATHAVASGPTERENTFSGSWRQPLWDDHALAAGWEFGRKQRDEYRRERQTDGAGELLLATDENYRATVARSAFFVQDEWDVNAAWSMYAGLRREDLRTTGAGNAATLVNVAAGAWSPIFQALFKPQRAPGDTGPRDQFRLAASRTYKAPGIVQLMPRRYTVDNDNSATNPDQQGNPALRPELATNLDLAWERTYGKAGLVSVSAFTKRIHDVTLTRLYQSAGVWIATPDNLGGATVRGLEFEGKATRGLLAARVNLARNWSTVDSVPGPDNRIEGQAAWSGNLGLDATTTHADAGATYTLRGPVVNRASDQLLRDDGGKRQLDVYAVWKRDRTARLRLSVANLLHRDYMEGVVYDGGAVLARTVTYRTHATWRLVWEQAL